MEHEDDADIDEPYAPPAGNVLEGKVDSQSLTEQPTLGDTAEGQGVVSFFGTSAALIMPQARLAPQLMLPSDEQHTSLFT